MTSPHKWPPVVLTLLLLPGATMPNPVQGGTIGRTDQGVDISASPGSRVTDPVPGTSVVAGRIADWFQGQPLEWFKVISGPFKGQYWYGAEQISFGVKIGQRIRQGMTIGKIAPSGTGTEFGWSTSTGETRAKATTGYTEGQVTPAGQQFKTQIIGAKGNAGQSSTLAQLWVQAGGSPKLANLMAAIALAESSGQTNATTQDANGTTDYGLWQINSSHGYDAARLVSDPLYNAQAAVAIEKSQGLGAWTTYNTGAYKKFLGQRGPKISYGGPNGGRVRPGPTGQSSQQVDKLLTTYESLVDTPRTAPPGTKSALQWWQAEFSSRLQAARAGEPVQ